MEGKRASADPLEELFGYHNPNSEQALRMDAIRESAKQFARTVIKHMPGGRDRRAVIRKIREAAMTANQCVMIGDSRF